MRLGLMLVLVGACGFQPGAAQVAMHDGAGSGSAVIDASEPDGNDALESNARRKPITFVKPGANLADFPVWIDLTDTAIATRALPNGHDIYFTDANGTNHLDREITSWDPATHRLTAWVRIPNLDSVNPTTIYVNYGDPGATSPQDPKSVFKSSFVAVWHLDDAIDAATIVDATTVSPGTPSFSQATTRTTGQLGTGFHFTDTTDTITFATPLTGNTPHTISVWVNQAANITHTAAIVAMGSPAPGQSRWLHGHYNNSSFCVGYYGPDVTPNPAVVIDNAGWTRLDWTYEGGATGRNHLFENGTEIANSPYTATGTINTPSNSMGYIGFAPQNAYGTNNGYEGTIDELRLAKVARSPSWIAAEYANQKTPATFYAVGAEEPVP